MFFLCTCSETFEDKTQIDEDKILDSLYSGTYFHNYDIFNRVAEYKEFVRKFISICKPVNHIEKYDIGYDSLINTRVNILSTYSDYNFSHSGNPTLYESVLLGHIYDKSYESNLNNYGYVLMLNGLIINVTKERVYYIAWENERLKYENYRGEGNDISSLFDSTAFDVITNLDRNVIKFVFNYEGNFLDEKVSDLFIKIRNRGSYKYSSYVEYNLIKEKWYQDETGDNFLRFEPNTTKADTNAINEIFSTIGWQLKSHYLLLTSEITSSELLKDSLLQEKRIKFINSYITDSWNNDKYKILFKYYNNNGISKRSGFNYTLIPKL